MPSDYLAGVVLQNTASDIIAACSGMEKNELLTHPEQCWRDIGAALHSSSPHSNDVEAAAYGLARKMKKWTVEELDHIGFELGLELRISLEGE